MSEKKPALEELAQRIDELLDILKKISDDLADVSNQLKTAVSPAAATTPQPSAPSARAGAAPSAQMRTIADVMTMFTKELEDVLFFEETDKYIIIKPRHYLGSDNFGKVRSIVIGIGGEYISAGKESHFRVPKEMR